LKSLPIVASLLVAACAGAALAPARVVAQQRPALLAQYEPSVTAAPTQTPVPAPERPPGLFGPHRHPAKGPSPTPSPAPSPTPSPSPSPAPRATPRPPVVTPTPGPIPTATRAPQKIRTVPSATPAPLPTRPPSTPVPIATPAPLRLATPAPHPSGALQPSGGLPPTILQSAKDPEVQRILRDPIDKLAQFSWLVGTWRTRDDTYIFAFTMKNRWIFGADGKANNYLYLTYDPFAHHFVLNRLENNPSYGIWTADGWQGDKMVFLSDAAYADGHPYHRRLTILRETARTFSIHDEEQLPDGSWTSDGTIELTKE